MTDNSRQLRERLRFLSRITRKEVNHLVQTTERLFSIKGELTEATVNQWVNDIELSERLDAFVSRFSRLQDTVGDKLLPSLLVFLGEKTGPAIDNLNRAEKLGWLESAEEWATYRKLRNQMVHEYIEEISVLTDALRAGYAYIPALVSAADRIAGEAERRLTAQ